MLSLKIIYSLFNFSIFGIDNEVRREVDNLLNILDGEIKQQAEG